MIHNINKNINKEQFKMGATNNSATGTCTIS